MQRSKYGLSHYRLLTCDMGELVPCALMEVLPGDTFQVRSSLLLRYSALVTPVMHPVQVRIHHWFVPNRLLWSGWEDLISGVDTTTPVPTVALDTNEELGDYLGVPPNSSGTLNVSALPFRAYNKIFNENYRDQDLVSEVTEDSQVLQRIAWEKDYFTASRPWPQKGAAVTIPLVGDAPVKGLGSSNQSWTASGVTAYETGQTAGKTYNPHQNISSGITYYAEEDSNNAGFPGIFADLSSVSAVSVESLRLAFAQQRFQEARARYGSRFTEYLRYLGVQSADSRLQRPEYLGGGRATTSFSEVLQTAEGTNAVGTLRGHGIAALRTRRYRRFFEEHGWIVGLLSIRPKSMYTQACHKSFLRSDYDDFWQKEFESLGMQEVPRTEVFADAGNDSTVFGYVDRYREYREHPSCISAEFRSTAAEWHLGRILGSAPTLNSSFTNCSPSKRIFADQTGDGLYVLVNNSVQARRLVRRRSRPGGVV